MSKSKKNNKTKQQRNDNHNHLSLSVSDQQKLSTKFQNIFDKQILSEYENDNFKECIKHCDRILNVYPKNGETLAMKGLCLHCEGSSVNDEEESNKSDDDKQKEQNKAKLRQKGLSLIADGLRCNLKSSICWRVKGLAHRKEKDFGAAIVCYKKAANYDKKNPRIYTDLAALQIEMRRYKAWNETRRELWLLNQDKTNCVALCVSLFLSGEYSECLRFIDDNILVDGDSDSHKFTIDDAVELNEVYLLKSRILIKQKKFEQCFDFLNKHLENNCIVDKLRGLQLKIQCCEQLKKFDDAAKAALELIDKCPENVSYHRQYLAFKGGAKMDADDNFLENKYPKCNAIKRLLLERCDDEKRFEVLLNEYLVKKIKKSVMSLYNDVRTLYENEWKGRIIDKLIDEYRKELSQNQRFNASDDKVSASPTCLLWVNYFYGSRLVDLCKFDSALKAIDETIEIVPTCIELYVLKAELYKCAGNKRLAFKYMDYARELDKADRYLNTKCVRYAFRAGENERAEDIVALFLKKSEGAESLNKLQVMWYQVHDAESHLFTSEYGPCIKQLQNIFNHFETFWKNQLDFHRYAYRKCAINAYIQMLAWNDTLRNHPYFMRAARNALKVWFKIYELQSAQNLKELEHGSSPQSELDKKKHRQSDPRGWKLIHCEQPLSKAKKWLDALMPLVDCIKEKDETNVTILFIYIANFKYLLHTKQYLELTQNINVLKQDYAHFVDHPLFVFNIFVMLDKLQSNEECKELMKNYDGEFLKSYYEQNKKDFERMQCVLKCCLEIKSMSEKIGYSINDILGQIMQLECTPMQCVEIRNILIKSKAELELFDKYASKRWPLQFRIEK